MKKLLYALPALIPLLTFMPGDDLVWLHTAPETTTTLHLRPPAKPPNGPETADLVMMFWLEEQIAAYVHHLDRETITEARRQLQTALDQSRAELAERAARVTPGFQQP